MKKDIFLKSTDLTPDELTDVLKLSNQCLGEKYLDKDFFHNKKMKCFRLYKRTRLIGFAANSILRGELPDYLSSVCKPTTEWGKQEVICIHKDYRNTGYGSILIEASVDWLSSITKNIFTLRWIKTEKDKNSTLLTKHNFIPAEVISGLWYEDSLKRNYQCPICKAPPCTCDAMLYIHKNGEYLS